MLVALWWLSFFTALGLCIGSFLNAVIYRLPRNRSLLNPRWSFCPNCKNRIAWYDNLPVISFMRLRGRCRHCFLPISTRYVVIELMMALVVLMLLDAFFISGVREGLSQTIFGLTDHLSLDWPILLAHLILFACLLPMAAIDLEHYWVDVRFTNFTILSGFVLHSLWTPKYSADWIRPDDTTAVMGLFAVVGLGLTWLVMLIYNAGHELTEEVFEEPLSDPEAPDQDQTSVSQLPPTMLAPSRAGAWVLGVITVVLFVILLIDESGAIGLKHTGRALIPLVFLFGLLVREGMVSRDADQEIVDAIQEERFNSRRMVFKELAMLLPALAAGLLALFIMTGSGSLSEAISTTLHVKVNVPGVSMMRNWSPVYGFATATCGMLLGGALGWGVRIFFTLLFGKEAFGMGDVHLMAAAGCVAGWPVVMLAFFLTCGLALLGWLIALPIKRCRALPLGPWLALSFLIVVVFYDKLMAWPFIARVPETINMLLSQNSQFPMLEGIR